MAKISALPEVTAPDGTETVVILKNGVAKRARFDNLAGPTLTASQTAVQAKVDAVAARDRAEAAANDPAVQAAGTDLAKGALSDIRRAPQAATDALAAASSVIAIAVSFGVKLPLNAVWAVLDGAGRSALQVAKNGIVTISTLALSKLFFGSTYIASTAAPGYVIAIVDKDGRIAAGLKRTGKAVFAKLEAPELVAGGTAVNRRGGVYPWQVNYTSNEGQSNALGSSEELPGLTVTREFDNVGFALGAVSPASWFPMTTANCSPTRGENPMYGTAGFQKALIAAENQYAFADNDYLQIGVTNAAGGTSILALKKGGTSGMYETRQTQVQSLKTIATGIGLSYGVEALTFTQGESDVTMTAAAYSSELVSYADTSNVDIKAITGQTRDVLFLMSQCSQYDGRNTIAPAYIDAATKRSYIHVCCPTYHLPYKSDSLHYLGAGLKWLGGYYGLWKKRIIQDGVRPEPLMIRDHAVIGNCIDLYYNKSSLEWETDAAIMPTQVNQGYTAFDAGGAAVTISSVAILNSNRVRLTFATPPQPGWTVKYGHINVVGKTNYTGCGGNLRSSSSLVYAAIGKPMHHYALVETRII